MKIQRLSDGKYRNKDTGRVADSVTGLQDADLVRKGHFNTSGPLPERLDYILEFQPKKPGTAGTAIVNVKGKRTNKKFTQPVASKSVAVQFLNSVLKKNWGHSLYN